MSESGITKKALAASLKELMTARPFSEITVGDICQNCGLNRKSLYYHFDDKYALVNWVFKSELIDRLDARPHSDLWELMEEIATYMHQNRMFYFHAFEIQGENCFRDYFARYLQPFFLVAIQNYLSHTLHFSVREKADAYAEFFSDACVYSLQKWIVHSPQISPERYVELFRL